MHDDYVLYCITHMLFIYVGDDRHGVPLTAKLPLHSGPIHEIGSLTAAACGNCQYWRGVPLAVYFVQITELAEISLLVSVKLVVLLHFGRFYELQFAKLQ
jgi:hypothetical protein